MRKRIPRFIATASSSVSIRIPVLRRIINTGVAPTVSSPPISQPLPTTPIWQQNRVCQVTEWSAVHTNVWRCSNACCTSSLHLPNSRRETVRHGSIHSVRVNCKTPSMPLPYIPTCVRMTRPERTGRHTSLSRVRTIAMTIQRYMRAMVCTSMARCRTASMTQQLSTPI